MIIDDSLFSAVNLSSHVTQITGGYGTVVISSSALKNVELN